LDSSWEQVDPREQGRPRRRYYRLNANGTSLARDALAKAYETRSRIVTRLRPAGETG
jgi:DNA-binding PadR family transcriptional regulator